MVVFSSSDLCFLSNRALHASVSELRFALVVMSLLFFLFYLAFLWLYIRAKHYERFVIDNGLESRFDAFKVKQKRYKL